PGRAYEEVFVPGNHDCLLPSSGRSRSREVMVAGLLHDPPKSDTGDLSMVEACLTVQDSFFAFVNRRHPEMTLSSDCPNSRLSYGHDIVLGADTVRVLCHNTSWMSQMHEKQGELLAPTWLPTEADIDPSAVSITLFHHPYNWLDANNARAFHNLVERSSD